MKFLHLQKLAFVGLLFMATTAKAQMVITEYFDIKEAVKVDLSDKKVQKSLYAKGILDIDWDATRRVLAIAYDPQQANMAETTHKIGDLIGSSTFSAKQGDKNRNKEKK